MGTTSLLTLTTKEYLKHLTKYKIKSLMFSEYLSELGYYQAAERTRICSSSLTFKRDDQTQKQTWYCKNRLCPLCAWKRSRKEFAEICELLPAIQQQRPNDKFLFLTLTIENVAAAELQATLRLMGRSVAKLFQRKALKQVSSGYIRTTEITFNPKLPETPYHPHMHLLLLLRPEYFSTPGFFISQSKWQSYWQKAMCLDYLPIVDIRKARPNIKKGQVTAAASVQEIAKYQVKATDYLTKKNRQQNLKVINELSTGLLNSRHISYSGIFRTTRKELTQSQSTSHRKFDTMKSTDLLVEWNNRQNRYVSVSQSSRPYMVSSHKLI